AEALRRQLVRRRDRCAGRALDRRRRGRRGLVRGLPRRVAGRKGQGGGGEQKGETGHATCPNRGVSEDATRNGAREPRAPSKSYVRRRERLSLPSATAPGDRDTCRSSGRRGADDAVRRCP